MSRDWAKHRRMMAADEVVWHHSRAYSERWLVGCRSEWRPGDLRTFDPLAVTCEACIAASTWVQEQRAKVKR